MWPVMQVFCRISVVIKVLAILGKYISFFGKFNAFDVLVLSFCHGKAILLEDKLEKLGNSNVNNFRLL